MLAHAKIYHKEHTFGIGCSVHALMHHELCNVLIGWEQPLLDAYTRSIEVCMEQPILFAYTWSIEVCMEQPLLFAYTRSIKVCTEYPLLDVYARSIQWTYIL